MNPQDTLNSIEDKALNIQKKLQEPTVGSIFKDFTAPTSSNAYDNSIGSIYKRAAEGSVNPKQIFRDKLNQYQTEIDAVNDLYREQVAQSKEAGQGRLGEARAMAARGGTLGSDFSTAQRNKVIDYNTRERQAIDAEKIARISAIENLARQNAEQERANREIARMQGADSYLEFLTSQKSEQEKGLQNLAASFLAQGVTPDEIDPNQLSSIASQFRTTADAVKAAYSQARALQGEADGFTLSEGQVRYDANGNVIASGQSRQDTQIITRADGSIALVDKNTGQVINELGSPDSGDLTQVQDSYGGQVAVSPLTAAIAEGIGNIEDLTPSDRAKVLEELQQSGLKTGVATKKAAEILSIAQDLLNDPSVNAITGMDRLRGMIPGTGAARAANKFKQLRGLLTLENMSLMKGVLSDSDMRVLQQAATSLNRNLSDKDFRIELQKIIEKTSLSSGMSIPLTDQELQAIEMMKADGLKDSEIEAILGKPLSFNQGTVPSNGTVKIGAGLALKTNNPGNLRYAGQAGAKRHSSGFAQFNTPEEGYEALKKQIKLDTSRGLTLAQFVSKYAPPNENDTNLYLEQMQSMTGARSNTPLSQINLEKLAQAVAKKESSTVIL